MRVILHTRDGKFECNENDPHQHLSPTGSWTTCPNCVPYKEPKQDAPFEVALILDGAIQSQTKTYFCVICISCGPPVVPFTDWDEAIEWIRRHGRVESPTHPLAHFAIFSEERSV